MTRRPVIIAAALALAAAAPAHAQQGGHEPSAPEPATTSVQIPGRYFAPAGLLVLTGQTVTWSNGDAVVHNIQADDHSFTSGALPPGASYAHAFDAPGVVKYVCTIHRQMRGTITVAALGLSGPATPIASGGRATLLALVPAGVSSVRLERLPAIGPPVTVGEAMPDLEGRATFTVAADAPARYRAVAENLRSEPVSVHVAPHVIATVARAGRTIRVHAHVSPAQAGAGVALETYVRERFDWAPLRRARLGARSIASFTLRSARRLRLRVRLSAPVGGYSRAASAPAVAVRAK